MTLNDFEENILSCLGVTREKLYTDKSRVKGMLAFRGIVFYFLKKHTNLSIELIGDRYDKDRLSVSNAIKNFSHFRNYNETIQRKVGELEEKFKDLPRIIVCKTCGREI